VSLAAGLNGPDDIGGGLTFSIPDPDAHARNPAHNGPFGNYD
jgi:hypothetical protein